MTVRAGQRNSAGDEMQSVKCKVKSEGAPRGSGQSAFCILHLRRGFTLVELLVVIAIISMVTLATVPMILPALDSRRIRESARIVSTQFASAQSEAIAKGRPVGVWIDRLSKTAATGTTAAMDLFLCEAPQPYAGDDTASGINSIIVDSTTKIATIKFSPTDASAQQAAFFHPGDLIRFNFRGPYFQIPGTASGGQPSNAATNNGEDITYNASQGLQIAPISASDYDSAGKPIYRALPAAAYTATGWQNVPYQILRRPVKSTSGPVQLPAGAIVDLYWSGMGSTGSFASPTAAQAQEPILVTFDRTGALDGLYIGGVKQSITSPLFFLIGKREKVVGIQTDPTQYNWLDLENIWVAINPQTGNITTAEVAAPTGGSLTAAQALAASRQYAQAAQAMGGR